MCWVMGLVGLWGWVVGLGCRAGLGWVVGLGWGCGVGLDGCLDCMKFHIRWYVW